MGRKRPITSIKQGRGPSFMGGVAALVVAVIGVIWVMVASWLARQVPPGMSPGGIASFFPVVGVLFIVLAVASAIYEFRNAFARERYSVIDITDSETEPDPLNRMFGPRDTMDSEPSVEDNQEPKAATFCPYCGKPSQGDFRFCPACGKELPL